MSIRRQLKRLAETMLRHDIVKVEPGFTVFVDQRYRADAWFSYRTMVERLLAQADIDLAIDVGANEGQFGRQLRSYYTEELLSFEPVAKPFAKLAAEAAASPGWHVHQCGLGRERSTRTIYVSDDTAFSSILRTNDYATKRFGRAKPCAEELVTMERLDDVLERTVKDVDRRRIFLKLDTQGFDVEAFHGLGSRIDQVQILQSEVSLIPLYDGMPHWTEVIEVYERAGLHISGMFPVTRDGSRVIEYDCLMVR
jgi:FkbM family methyltransferase